MPPLCAGRRGGRPRRPGPRTRAVGVARNAAVAVRRAADGRPRVRAAGGISRPIQCGPMRLVPRRVLLSSGCAPVVLVGGWTGAALFEGTSDDPVTQAISVLGPYGAPGFWVMTLAFVALGVCRLLTAWGLRAAATAGRVALAGGGLAALAVAVLPAPSSGGSSRHGAVTVVGHTLLAVWPVLAVNGGCAAPWALRLAPSFAATALMAAGGACFLVVMSRHGDAGVVERVVTAAQPLLPWWSPHPASATLRGATGPQSARSRSDRRKRVRSARNGARPRRRRCSARSHGPSGSARTTPRRAGRSPRRTGPCTGR